MNDLQAILHLQESLKKRFGDAVQTDSGAGTIQIGHNSVFLVDDGNAVVARGPINSAKKLKENSSK
jgi:hypothetical protein